MKIVTLGMSPYIYLSHAKIHSLILKDLFFSHHQVACIATGHDTTYFLPELDKDNHPRYYYQFDQHKVPLVPLNHTKDPAIHVYEILKVFSPDIILTIGDFNDHLYIKAVKMFLDNPIKWLAVLVNYSYPINEKNKEIIQDLDGIICTNSFTFKMFQPHLSTKQIKLSYVGSTKNETEKSQHSGFKVMVCGKNTQGDNLPLIMQALSEINLPDINLYLHTNMFDQGDYDLNLLKERFDPQGLFISFPDKYVSLIDGYPENEYLEKLLNTDIFINLSVNSASAISVFESLACGCWPLMSNTACHKDIAHLIAKNNPQFESDEFLVNCTEWMVRGENYINIPHPQDFKEKIKNLHDKKKGGSTLNYQELLNTCNHSSFLKDVRNMIEIVKNSNSTLCVENLEEI